MTDEKWIVEYDVADAAIQTLATKYEGMEIVDIKSYQAVVAGIREVRGLRIQVENKRKELKKDALAWGRKVDGEAKRITAMLLPIEDQLKGLKEAEDERKAAIRAEKERIEQERIQGIRNRIATIEALSVDVNILPADEIQSVLSEIDSIEITEAEYQEFQEEAERVFVAVRQVVQMALETRIRLDNDGAARRAEAERLEKIRAEQEAEAKRLAEIEAAQQEERRKIQAAKDRIEAERMAEIQRKEREEREKRIAEEAAAQAIKDAEAKAKREKAERIAREKAEAERLAREEALKPDKEKMADFANWLESNSPDLKDPEAQDFFAEISIKLSQIATELREWTGKETDEYSNI